MRARIVLVSLMLSCYKSALYVECSKVKPNIVILIVDDLGIGDLGCFGNDTIRTPNIDRLAKEGLKLTHHLSAAALCTPSRAALLTSRYAARYGLTSVEGTSRVILHLACYDALPNEEITLAEALSAANYVTAAIGKWHLGSGCGLFGRGCVGPKYHGFSYFYGIPVTLLYGTLEKASFFTIDTNDPLFFPLGLSMLLLSLTTVWLSWEDPRWKLGSKFVLLLIVYAVSLLFITHVKYHSQEWWEISPWLRQRSGAIVINNVGQTQRQMTPYPGLSQELVDESVRFIERASKGEKPFFLYHSFAHVHTPMFTSEENEGRSAHGIYGDNVEEVDDGVGAIAEALKRNDVEGNTIVYFLSDHGGHLEVIDPITKQRIGGHNGRFKGGKGQGGSEGGIRVPGILKWPNRIPPNASLDHPVSLLDMMPTLLELAQLPTVHDLFPDAQELDGKSMSSTILHPEDIHETKRILIHHCFDSIHALRLVTETEVYKLHLKMPRYDENSTKCGMGNVYCPCYGDGVLDMTESPILFELKSDPFEDRPIDKNSPLYKEIVFELRDFLEKWRNKVTYPPSQFTMWKHAFLPWLQPVTKEFFLN